MKKTLRAALGIAAALVALILSFMPVITSERDIAIPAHHFDHAALMLLGAVAALCLYRRRSGTAESAAWIWPALVVPLVAMVLMAPNLYAMIDRTPFVHSFDHVLFVLAGAVTAYAGQRYVNGVGWATTIFLELMAVAAVFGYGVAPPVASAPEPAQASAASTLPQTPPDLAHGKVLFAQDCASCHGASGGGGMGPSLRNERVRKNAAAAAAWIKKPAPPMPGLYPSVLNDKDVRDVAAFVETLK